LKLWRPQADGEHMLDFGRRTKSGGHAALGCAAGATKGYLFRWVEGLRWTSAAVEARGMPLSC